MTRHRPVALVTYSTKPRGGVVHTLALAEALHAAGVAGAGRRRWATRPPGSSAGRRAGHVVPGPAGDGAGGEGRRQHRPAAGLAD